MRRFILKSGLAQAKQKTVTSPRMRPLRQRLIDQPGGTVGHVVGPVETKSVSLTAGCYRVLSVAGIHAMCDPPQIRISPLLIQVHDTILNQPHA